MGKWVKNKSNIQKVYHAQQLWDCKTSKTLQLKVVLNSDHAYKMFHVYKMIQ